MNNIIEPKILKRLDSYQKKDWLKMLQDKKLTDIAAKCGVSTYIISRYINKYIGLPKVKPIPPARTDDVFFEDVPIVFTEGAWMESKEREAYLAFIHAERKISA